MDNEALDQRRTGGITHFDVNQGFLEARCLLVRVGSYHLN